jgi:hypothetical protein
MHLNVLTMMLFNQYWLSCSELELKEQGHNWNSAEKLDSNRVKMEGVHQWAILPSGAKGLIK